MLQKKHSITTKSHQAGKVIRNEVDEVFERQKQAELDERMEIPMHEEAESSYGGRRYGLQ